MTESHSTATKYTSKLHGVRVLIIGGTSGIGFGVAEALVEHGATVIVSSSSPERVERALQRLKATYHSCGDRVYGIPCNLNDQNTLSLEVENLFSEIAKQAGSDKLDHVVHTAGDDIAVSDFQTLSVQDIQQAGMVRFFSPLIVAQHLRKHLNEGPGSSYIMTTGGLTSRPRPGWVVLMSYLTGLEGMMMALAKELAPIRVNLVGPGPTDTERWATHRETGQMETFKAQLAKTLAVGRFGRVEDVVEAYLYLMKDQNVTGHILQTNGGGHFM